VSARAALLIGLAWTAACDSSTVGAGTAGDARGAVCPATPEETIGAACGFPGLRCGPQYTCGFIAVSILCVCTDGVFRCTDATGAALDAGTPPTCPQGTPAESCPSTELAANLARCTEQGLLCAYPASCTSRFDQCQCFPGAMANGQFGLRFECTPGCGALDGGVGVIDSGGAMDSRPAPDAGQNTDSAGGDAFSDASSDSPSEDRSTDSDGTTDDGRAD
jgi:hypothetical protein